MTRLIDADALKEAINNNGCRHSHYFDVFDVIDDAPTVTPIDEAFSTAIDKHGDNTFSVSVISSKGEKIDFKQVKRGKWIKTNDYVTCAYGCIDYVKCSCCKNDSLEEGDFCPNCGAEMKEAEE